MRYQTILADPPWHYKEFCQIHTKAGRVVKPLPYSSMSLEEIENIPIKACAEVNCRLFIWTTNRFLPDSFSVIKNWGFSYKQTIVWHKVGNPSPWGGSIAPNHAEFLLVATIGNPPRLAMLESNVIRHSEKPLVFQDLIEQVSPPPYLELFARRKRLGWDTWGNEVDCDLKLI